MTESPTLQSVLRTRVTDLLGSPYPILQTGMGWVATPELVAGACNAGAFGFLAAATIPPNDVEAEILAVKRLTAEPFGVNFLMDAPGADVIASVDEAGEYASLFVYEKGAEMADGSLAAERRIGIWVAQAGDGPLVFENLSDDGLKRIETSVQLLKMFDRQAKVIKDYTWLEAHLGKLVPMEVVLRVDQKKLRPKDQIKNLSPQQQREFFVSMS